MRNFIAVGNTMEFTAAADVASGAVVVVEDVVGIAAGDVADGASGVLNLGGVYELPKAAAQPWAAGTRVYWNGSAATTTEASNTLLGVAYRAAASAAETGYVRLNGSF